MNKVKLFIIVLSLLASFLLSGQCGDADASKANNTADAGVSALGNAISFKDPVLESVIRDAVNKPDGVVYRNDVESLKTLSYNADENYDIADGAAIKDLAGIERLTNMTSLSLDNNYICDVTPLKTLTHLKTLSLHNNLISSIEPLRQMKDLESLYIGKNRISDISPVAKMTKLVTLYIADNRISDIRALKGLNGLHCLFIGGNYKIKDFSVLSGLGNVTRLGADILDKKGLQPLRSMKSLRVLTYFGYENTVRVFNNKSKVGRPDLSSYELLLDTADRIIEACIKKDMSVGRKELAINDYVVKNISYDYDGIRAISQPGLTDEEMHLPGSAYGALINKKCVCTGFANTMCLLLNKTGIECMFLGSQQESHAWNIVRLDGEYYHVDTSREVTYASKHLFFNVTDNFLSATHAWDKDRYPKCAGTKYSYDSIISEKGIK